MAGLLPVYCGSSDTTVNVYKRIMHIQNGGFGMFLICIYRADGQPDMSVIELHRYFNLQYNMRGSLCMIKGENKIYITIEGDVYVYLTSSYKKISVTPLTLLDDGKVEYLKESPVADVKDKILLQ